MINIRNGVYFFSTSLNDGYLEVWHHSRADPGFKKRGGAVASGARSQDFFGQFRDF